MPQPLCWELISALMYDAESDASQATVQHVEGLSGGDPGTQGCAWVTHSQLHPTQARTLQKSWNDRWVLDGSCPLPCADQMVTQLFQMLCKRSCVACRFHDVTVVTVS